MIKYKGDLVFDPFMGSGTTAVIAKKLKRNYLGFEIEKIEQNIVFILKIEIDGAVRDTRFPRDLRNGRLKKTLFGKHLDSRFKDAPVFIVCFPFRIDDTPPEEQKTPLMNEYSFI